MDSDETRRPPQIRGSVSLKISQADIDAFHDIGSDIIAKAQEIVDGLEGSPHHGYETIGVDTILVAMMLVGAARLVNDQ